MFKLANNINILGLLYSVTVSVFSAFCECRAFSKRCMFRQVGKDVFQMPRMYCHVDEDILKLNHLSPNGNVCNHCSATVTEEPAHKQKPVP